jgi:hypothetical protein
MYYFLFSKHVFDFFPGRMKKALNCIPTVRILDRHTCLGWVGLQGQGHRVASVLSTGGRQTNLFEGEGGRGVG